MLTSIEIENYRLFEKYRLAGLRRVNLLVGKNNCGKTSVLEAVQLLVSGGNPALLTEIAFRRGEVGVIPSRVEPGKRYQFPEVSHLFPGHRIEPGVCLRIRGDGDVGEVTVRAVDLADVPEGSRRAHSKVGLAPKLALRFEGGKHPLDGGRIALPVTREGAIVSDLVDLPPELLGWRSDEFAPVDFVNPQSLEPAAIREMWDRASKACRESQVEQTLMILEPGLKKLLFLSREEEYQPGGNGGILVECAGIPGRHPLGSFGDGVRRLLALSLAIVQPRGGVLLLDEIDAGLHYSIMPDIWRLVVEGARTQDVQVFATTHSLDCVLGLASVCENYPELGVEISLQKIVPELEEAVAFDAKGIRIVAEQGIEVR